MMNLQKTDKQTIPQPNIILFASPSITPSNNYKSQDPIMQRYPNSQFNQTKDLNNSNIHGRKIDSPQLRVTAKDFTDRPQTASISQGSNFRKEEFIQMYNHANQFNQTNKEIQKKQLDFNIKPQKANVTIQYEEKVPTAQPTNKHHRPSKSIGSQQKKRQQSQSVPKHQPSASIVNTNNAAQPLINLHIQNAKLASQSKQIPQRKKIDQSKYQSAIASGQQSVPYKSKSKSKGRPDSKYAVPSGTGNAKPSQKSGNKYALNQSNMQKKIADFAFSFDNKENQSINYNEFSPSRIIGGKQRNQNLLDSDSSVSSPQLHPEQAIANQLGKSYFMDKSALLKHLSPERSQRPPSQKYPQVIQPFQPIISDRERKDSRDNLQQQVNYRSNGSTITNQLQPGAMQSQPESTLKPVIDNAYKNYEINKRAVTQQNNVGGNSSKIYLKGVDRLIKENLKRNKHKEEEEVNKRFFEEYRQKLKKAELSQRNQEVRKINASKIIFNHKHKHSQLNNMANVTRITYKKQRSKSCMNKTDNIFGGLPKSKERAPAPGQTAANQDSVPQKFECKKERKREKSFVLELKELKKQIDDEIRREILAGKLEVPTATHKKTNLTTLHAKKEYQPMSNKKEYLNMSALESKPLRHGTHSKGEISMIQKPKSKSKSKEHLIGKNISIKIKKFIEKKKKLKIATKSLEQTIENEKHLKIKENLKNLNQFVKQHFRQQSYNFYFKKPALNKEHSSGENALQVPIKKLKPHFFKKEKGTRKKSQEKSRLFNFQGETIFDNEIQEHPDAQTPNRYDAQNKDNDVSREFYDDYQKLLNSINKHSQVQAFAAKGVNDDKSIQQSISIEISPQRKSSSHKKKKKKSSKTRKTQQKLVDELEQSNDMKKKFESQGLNWQRGSTKSEQALGHKSEHNILQVNPNKNPTLIPPQSDIATMEKNLEKSNISLKDNTDKKSQQRGKISQDSSKKSPSTVDLKRKMRILMQMYGGSVQRCLKTKVSDTKLLIKLHSSAITIQQNFRKCLQSKGFYESDEEDHSKMYVDSEEDQKIEYEPLSSVKKQLLPPANQLQVQSSPLRVKKLNNNKQGSHLDDKVYDRRSGNVFYPDDSSDVEKVIVCSVISSARPEGDESLQNTQQYIPLRQKVKKEKIPSSTSSANSGFNTAIKTLPQPQPSKIQEQQQKELLQDSSLSSQRKNLVPSLDFGKLMVKDQQQHQSSQKEGQEESKRESSTGRSIFERNPFQEFQIAHNKQDFNLNNYPELLRLREEAIKYRESYESKVLQKMFKAQQVSPRTYDQKRKDIEVWVTKEKDEVKKTRKVFEQQWQKTAQMIEETQKNQELMKKLIHGDNQQTSNVPSLKKDLKSENLPSENTMGQMLSSHRVQSSRRESKLLDMIYDDDKKQQQQQNSQDESYQLDQQRQKDEAQKLQRQLEQQQRDAEEQKKKKAAEELLLKQQEAAKKSQKEKDEELKRVHREQQEEEERKRREREAKLKELEDERERKRELEEERQRKADQQKKDQEIKDRMKRDWEEQQRKDNERKEKERQEKEKKEQQKKESDLLEQQRKDQEKQQQKMKQEQDRLDKLKKDQDKLDQQRRDQERLDKERKDKERQEQERKDREKKQKEDEEEKERQRKQKAELQKQLDDERRKKEIEDQKERERKAKEMEIEKQNQEREEKNKEKAQQKEKWEKQQQALQSKLAQIESKFDKNQSKSQPKDLIPSTQQDKSKQGRYDYFGQEQEDLNSEPDFGIDDDIDVFSHNMDKQLLQDILDVGGKKPASKVKEILESEETEPYLEEETKALSHNQDKTKENEEPSRGLSRTRSSQYLQDNRESEGEIEEEPIEQKPDRQDLIIGSEEKQKIKEGLNDESMDEDTKDKTKSQKPSPSVITPAVKQDNFFTKNFDEEKPEDILDKIKNSTTSDLKKLIELEEDSVESVSEPPIKKEEQLVAKDDQKPQEDKSNSKIYIEDKGEEVKDNNLDVQIHFQLSQDDQKKRLTQDMRNRIPTEEEERVYPGMPVSPVSVEGVDIKIQTGSQSLESTLTDGKEIKQAIQEVVKQDDENQKKLALEQPTSERELLVEGITDDIFRILMSEMKVELDLLLISDPRRFMREESGGNHYLSESGRFLIFERRGIKTDLFAIERYVEEVLDEVLKDRNKFTHNIQQAISKNAKEVLNQLQNSEIGSYEHFEINYPAVLPLELYLKLEKRRKETRENQRDQEGNFQNNVDRNFLAECEHIHNKVLFDCINDSLLQFKPYGKEGAPLLWSRQNRRLKPIEDFTVEEMFEIVKHDLFRWAIMQAGTLPRKEFVFGGVFDDELFAEIREKKLATLLAREMIENEPKWLNYEFEEAQVKIDIGDMILEQLVTETITILNDKIGNRQL